MKNFYYRFILVATVVLGILFIGSVPEMMKSSNWLIFGGIFLFLYTWTSHELNNLSSEKINEILCIDTFKKFGININE